VSTAAPLALKRAVVGIDFSESSLAAATWVAGHVAPGVELVLVHALHVPEPPSFLQGKYPPRERLIETARAGAERRLRELSGPIAAGLIWTEVRVGAPDEQIVSVAAEYHADLIVVGSHGERPGLWSRLGSTAERVLSRAAVPVLVVQGAPRTPPRKLLVAVDDSDVTLWVLEWARALVRRFDATATVLYVVTPSLATLDPLIAVGGVMPVPSTTAVEIEQSVRAAAMRWLEERIGTQESGAGLQPAVAVGAPASTILAEAAERGSDLIVLGSRGLGTAKRLLLGSVSGSVLRRADRPVLVVSAADAVRG
jgi:nucleotide-binding universal stress UspA family protein